METAEPVAHAKNLRIQVCEAANELQFGEWTGKSFAELDPLPEWHRFNTLRSSARIPGGELMLEVQARIVNEMECMRRRHPNSHVAIVSHGDVIKAAVAHFAGIPLDLFHRIEISPAGVSTLLVGNWGAKIFSLNETVPA